MKNIIHKFITGKIPKLDPQPELQIEIEKTLSPEDNSKNTIYGVEKQIKKLNDQNILKRLWYLMSIYYTVNIDDQEEIIEEIYLIIYKKQEELKKYEDTSMEYHNIQTDIKRLRYILYGFILKKGVFSRMSKND